MPVAAQPCRLPHVPFPEDLRDRPWTQWVTLACRLLLGIVLFVAGLLKVVDLARSVQSVRLYQMLPFDVTAVVGNALPILEIAVGLALITGTFTRLAAVAGSLFMIAFIIAISSVWARGISIDCGCFGQGGEIAKEEALASYPWEIARDAGLLLTGLWTIVKPRAPFAVDQWLFALPEPAGELEADADDEQVDDGLTKETLA